MDEDKVREFFQQMDTWRFLALVLIGLCAGMFLTADQVIDDVTQAYNNCQWENFVLENPEVQRNRHLDLDKAQEVMNFSLEVGE